MTLDPARLLWCALADVPVAFPPSGVTVVVSPSSQLCPPGWCGVVTLGPSAIATVPTAALKPVVEAALADLPTTGMTDAHQVRAALPARSFLGPAALAYLDPADFTPPSAPASVAPASVAPASVAPASGPAAGPVASVVPVSGVADLVASVSADDAGESGLDEITSPAFVLAQDGRVVAAAGYRRWPTGVAHLSVLTAPSQRGRGMAHAVAGHAVADALSNGLFPQWRARPLASRRVARALGFHELGAQLSFEVS
ncbi:GNAT family N-acetyltransferase [Actinoplanes sp. NPDC051411]|uniref:GNAT family N-acetyltransferase n=1 Tax=Actinoplanes sp. NPDC051411 TaxID=3155522 RepID=UPI00341E3677